MTTNRPKMTLQRNTSVKALVQSNAYSSRIRELLKDRAPQFCTSLISISQQYHLKKCNPESIVAAAMTAAALDLAIQPTFGFAYIVPYGANATFQIGYKGLIQLAQRSGQYRHLNAFVVYDGDTLNHDPVTSLVTLERGEGANRPAVGYGAYMATTSGFEHAIYWTKAEVEAHAARFSQAYKNQKKDSPWFTDFDAMALKTVLKNLLVHWGPMSVAVQTAVENDGAAKAGNAEPMFPDSIEVEQVTVDEPADVPDTEPKPKAKRAAKPTAADKAAVVVLSFLEANNVQESELCRWASEEHNLGGENVSELPAHIVKSIASDPQIWLETYKQFLQNSPEPETSN